MIAILSSYLLDDTCNDRIARAAARHGMRFIAAPASPEERAARLDARIAEADILLGGRISDEQVARAARLRWMHVPWAGINGIVGVRGLLDRDIVITNSSGVMSDSVADQVMAYILLMARDLPRQIRAQTRAEWLRYTLQDTPRRIVRGMRLGVLGYGAIGSAIARRARAFGMRVSAMRRTAGAVPGLERVYRPEELLELLADSDVVVVALPLNDATRGLIGRAELAAMRRSAYLVNVARGAIIDQEALTAALGDGTIAAAALDVFEQEPLVPSSPLWSMPNVIVTPHTAGGFAGFWDAVTDLFLENLERFVDGAELLNRVDLRVGY